MDEHDDPRGSARQHAAVGDTDPSEPIAGVVAGAPVGGRRPTLSGLGGRFQRADRAFARLTSTTAVLLLVLLAAIAVFLVARAIPALSENEANFLTETAFFPNQDPPRFGVLALVWGTLLSSVLALLMAVPVAIGVAVFIAYYAPRRLAQPLGYVVDLLAAVPSVVYGLWGIFVLNERIVAPSAFLDKWLGWIPLFDSDGTFGRSVFLASVVLAIMVLPIIAAISREVFLQVPVAHREAAYALGATRWEMIRTAVLPYSRPGVIAASMLGLGRALGETIAVALVLSTSPEIIVRILEPGGNTIAANIATQFAEAGDTGRGALIATGLVLFVVTLAVNMTARAIVARRREFSGAAA